MKTKHNWDAIIPTHSRESINEPSWIIVNSSAAHLLETAAYALDAGTDPIALRAFQPGEYFRTTPSDGRLYVNCAPGGKIVPGGHLKGMVGGTALCSPKPGKKSMAIFLGKHRENVDALLKAALLCEAGHQVMLFTDGNHLYVWKNVGAALR